MDAVSYPGSIGSRILLGLKWAWRGLLILVGLLAVAWSGALLIGSSRLDSKLSGVRSDPRFTWQAPKDWDRPGPGDNAAPYFSAAFALVARLTGPENINGVLACKWTELSEKEQAALREHVKRSQGAFELAAKGADQPWCRYPRNWEPMSPRGLQEEAGRIFPLIWMLMTRAWVQTADGAHAEARETIRVALAAADSLRDDPFLVSQQSRLSAHKMILAGCLRLVPSEATVADLEAWLKLVPGPDRFDGCLDQAMRRQARDVVELLSGPLGRFWEHYATQLPGYRRYDKTLQRRLADPLVKLDGVRALDDFARILDLLGKPYLEARPEGVRMDEIRRRQYESWHPVVTHFVPWLKYHLDDLQETRAMCVVLRTGLEWELARLKNGNYPERCDTLDPLTDKPLQLEAGPARLTCAGLKTMSSYHGFIGTSWILRGK
jgi:hypothetical protein